MAGKSSYIKQVALITILSHIGSFVPAEYVHMPPIDKVFARVGTSDSILGNASTFFLEMQVCACESDANSDVDRQRTLSYQQNAEQL
jgi:DNA mismatch repair protein MutS